MSPEDAPALDPLALVHFAPANASTIRMTVSGEIDMATGPHVANTVRRAITAEHTRIEVDLSAVTFIDSAGIGTLVDARACLHDHGLELVLHRPSEVVIRLLELLGLTLFEIEG
jgi:anti-sigma B factor antagonist